MVIDSSAIIAIVEREPEAPQFASAIAESPVRLMSAASLLETAIIVEVRYRDDGTKLLDELLSAMQIQIIPVTVDQVAAARVAYKQYGRENHEARLNFGDCFSYALAKTTDEPLLFKGDDFNQTDLPVISFG